MGSMHSERISVPLRLLISNRTTVSIAWTQILNPSIDMDTRERLRILFPANDYIESQDFSLLHQTILGLNNLDLDALLASIPDSTINYRDVNGRTPLFWAAQRGDYKAVLSLLNFKADAQLATNGGSLPLDIALYFGHQSCSRLLLQHMTSTNYHNCQGFFPLHWAAHGGTEPDILDKILSLGNGINSVTTFAKYTALVYSAQENHPRVCHHLLSRNAKSEIANIHGETPLHAAIDYNSHESLQLLLLHVDYRLKTHAGETLFHYVAQYADVKTLEILLASDLHEINTDDIITHVTPNQKSPKFKGLKGLQIAELRTDVTPEWLATFRRLREKIDRFKMPSQDVQGTEESDEFHDALDTQDQGSGSN